MRNRQKMRRSEEMSLDTKSVAKERLRMQLLSELSYPSEQIGHLVVLDKKDKENTVYVIFDIDEINKKVFIVELDRPLDGNNKWLNIETDDVYLLSPKDVVERVQEWK
jgi:hypothetical protein